MKNLTPVIFSMDKNLNIWHGDEPSWLKERLLLFSLTGSRAYGTNRPDSDYDYKGIAISPKEYYFGLKSFDSYHSSEGTDPNITIYDLKKFFNLALSANPSIIELLYMNPFHYAVLEPPAKLLVENRKLFLSKKCYKSFVGYANSQLHRIKTREGKPNHGKGDTKRLERIKRYGYETKNALHLVRILKMGIEALETGSITVDRTGIDAKELVEILYGKYKIDELIEYSEDLFERAEEALLKTSLPDSPDFKAVDLLLQTITKACLE